MKTLTSVCLGAALLVAAGDVLAADAPPKETPEQRTARQTTEAKEAEAKINAFVKDFFLLTGPGWEENYGKFRAELARVRSEPEFQHRLVLAPSVKVQFGRPLAVPKPMAQVLQERREAELATLRQQVDKLLVKQPGLRDYAEQQFQWHKRLAELQDQHHGNAQVRQLVRNRLEAPGRPAARP